MLIYTHLMLTALSGSVLLTRIDLSVCVLVLQIIHRPFLLLIPSEGGLAAGSRSSAACPSCGPPQAHLDGVPRFWTAVQDKVGSGNLLEVSLLAWVLRDPPTMSFAHVLGHLLIILIFLLLSVPSLPSPMCVDYLGSLSYS